MDSVKHIRRDCRRAYARSPDYTAVCNNRADLWIARFIAYACAALARQERGVEVVRFAYSERSLGTVDIELGRSFNNLNRAVLLLISAGRGDCSSADLVGVDFAVFSVCNIRVARCINRGVALVVGCREQCADLARAVCSGAAVEGKGNGGSRL